MNSIKKYTCRVSAFAYSILPLATAANLNWGGGAAGTSRGDGHRSLVTPERVLSEYRPIMFLFFDK